MKCAPASTVLGVVSFVAGISGVPPMGLSAEVEAWKVKWEKTLEMARKEGEVRVYHSQGFGDYFLRFQRTYPEIKLVTVAATGSVLGQRILSERRAGRTLADLYIDGIDTARMLYQRNGFAPFPPALILPEVTDPAIWWEGRHHYTDPERHTTFLFQGTPKGASVAYNTKLVNAREFKSYWDFLRPKWRGKIVAIDPDARSIVSHSLRFLYYNPEIGFTFVRRFFSETDITLTRDRRQMLDWLAVDKFSVAFFGSDVEDAKRQGLPVEEFEPTIFKEGVAITSTVGVIGLLNPAPHPNAAWVLINWLLSREGQIALQKELYVNGFNSMREDIPKEPDILPAYRRKRGVKYLQITRPEFLDMEPVFGLVKEALKGKK